MHFSVLGTPFAFLSLSLLVCRNHHLLTICMAPKRKCDDPTPSTRTPSYTHDDFSDSEEPVQATQTNIIIRAGHDSRGRPTIHTTHTSYENNKFPDLETIFGALDDNDKCQMNMYGGEEFVAPLEDNTSPSNPKHQVPEERNTVSPL